MKSPATTSPGGLQWWQWQRWKEGARVSHAAFVIWDTAVKFADEGPFFFWMPMMNESVVRPCKVPTAGRNSAPAGTFITDWWEGRILMGAHKAGARCGDQYAEAKFTMTIQLEMK